jgi:hypothetical protein
MRKIDLLIEGAFKKPRKFKETKLDKNPQMDDTYASWLTHFQLKLEIDQRDKYINKLEKILNNKVKLKKVIHNKSEMDRLQKALDKFHKKELVPDFERDVVKQVPNRKKLGLVTGVNAVTLNKFLKIDSLEQLGKGISTIIFKHPYKKDKILALCTDAKKIDWFEANKELFGYKFITEMEYERSNRLYIYEADKINKFLAERDLSAYRTSLIYTEVVAPYTFLANKTSHEVTVKDLDWIMKPISDKELLGILRKVKEVFSPNDAIDLHGDQWGENKRGQLILFDPVIDTRLFNNLNNENTLSWKTKLKHFWEKLTTKKDSEIEKIIKKIKR